MSKELLFEFPDNSVFDFDHTQSSIWSPLVPRVHSLLDLDMDLMTPRKLTLGFGLELDKKKVVSSGSKKTTSSNTKKKANTSSTSINVNFLTMKQQKKKTLVKASDFSPTPGQSGACAPFTSRVWNKVLKAASKHFKKKKKDPKAHVKLSTYLSN